MIRGYRVNTRVTLRNGRFVTDKYNIQDISLLMRREVYKLKHTKLITHITNNRFFVILDPASFEVYFWVWRLFAICETEIVLMSPRSWTKRAKHARVYDCGIDVMST